MGPHIVRAIRLVDPFAHWNSGNGGGCVEKNNLNQTKQILTIGKMSIEGRSFFEGSAGFNNDRTTQPTVLLLKEGAARYHPTVG